MNDRETLTLSEKISYGCGDLSSNLLWGMTGSYIMYYYTDVVNIRPGRVALLLLLVRLFDACFDPLVGWLIDRSHDAMLVTRLIRWLAVPFGLTACLAFLPLPLSENGAFAWAALTYTLLGAIYAGINTPYGMLSNLMTTWPQQRVALSSLRMIGSQCGMLIIALLTLPAIHWLGEGTDIAAERRGFPLYMAAIGVLGSLLWWVTLHGCTLRHPPEPHPQRLKILLSSLLRNQPWLLCTALFSLYFISLSGFYSFTLYFSRYVLMQKMQFGGYILTLLTLCSLAGSACVPVLTRRMERRKILLAGYSLQIVLLAIIGIIPLTVPVFMLLFMLISLLLGFNSPLYYALIADSIDSGMVTSGVRTAGLAWSINSLMTKVGFAIGGSILAHLLAASHYDPQALAQTAQTVRYIVAGFIWMPVIVALISLPLLWWLPDDQKILSNK